MADGRQRCEDALADMIIPENNERARYWADQLDRRAADREEKRELREGAVRAEVMALRKQNIPMGQ